MAKTDEQLKRDIEAELGWDPAVNAAEIGVSVDGGVVSLLGNVDTYAQKWAAEDATKRVAGVRMVARDLKVKIKGEHERSDSDIAAAIQISLEWDVLVPNGVIAGVRDGSVTLEGNVPWHFQREAAERAVRNVTGVTSVFNAIILKPDTSVTQVKEKVEAALQRQATADAESIRVDLNGGTVTLTGRASSWQSIEDATNAAWAAPGVTQVVQRVAMQMTT